MAAAVPPLLLVLLTRMCRACALCPVSQLLLLEKGCEVEHQAVQQSVVEAAAVEAHKGCGHTLLQCFQHLDLGSTQ